jgi:hypothetical protein
MVYFVSIWSILLPVGIFCDHFVWSYGHFYRFGMLYQEKSGNPASVRFINQSCHTFFFKKVKNGERRKLNNKMKKTLFL